MPSEDTTPLRAAEVDALLPTLQGWTHSEAVLARTFVFTTFPAICRVDEYVQFMRGTI